MKNSKLLESLELKSAIESSCIDPVERITNFTEILSKLSGNPDKFDSLRKLGDDIDSEDIGALRILIADEVKKLKYLNTTEVTEQIFFLIIGALKLDAKQGSFSDPWYLANQGIKTLVIKNKKNNGYKYTFFCLIFITVGTLLWFINSKYHTNDGFANPSAAYTNDLEPLPKLVLNPYIPSHFYSLKAQMDKTTCQFPQAAMLPAEQRAAFLNFINTGKIALEELSNLQKALSRVNCDYTPLVSRIPRVNE